MAYLIAFYSRADENYFGGELRYVDIGNTEKVARKIQALTGGDLFKIQQKEPYAADYKTCGAQAWQDLKAAARPELVSLPASLAGYEVVYLGYPNYCGTMPMAVYTFLESYDWTGKIIRPFCTHEGSGLSLTEQDIARAAKGALVGEGLAIRGSDVDTADATIAQWCEG